jgi:hypothetical protein
MHSITSEKPPFNPVEIVNRPLNTPLPPQLKKLSKTKSASLHHGVEEPEKAAGEQRRNR